MSKLMGRQAAALKPYVPGEQPQDRQYIKLNTNESPYPPAPGVIRALSEEGEGLRLYPDPEVRKLREAVAQEWNISPEQIFAGNGSDEVLAFAYMAFFDRGDPVYYSDITYGFYPVYADLFGLRGKEIPLREGFRLEPADYYGLDGGMFIANPNAPTGLCLSFDEVEGIVKANPDQLVAIDEAYVDFGGESVVPLISRYDNLLVIQTFSKSRSLAGGRLGFGFGCPEIICALNRIKFSFNPYNINRMTAAAGIEAVRDRAYFQETRNKIVATRERVKGELRGMGFIVTDSHTNFLFAAAPGIGGGTLYQKLKERGILVRHFAKPRIDPYIRVTVGTEEEMDAFLQAAREMLREEKEG